MVLHIPNVLNNEQLIKCREILNNAEWIDGKLTAGSQAINVKSNLQLYQNHLQLMHHATNGSQITI